MNNGRLDHLDRWDFWGLGFDDGDRLRDGNTLDQLSSLRVAGSIAVESNVLGVARCSPEEVEDGDAVVFVGTSEGVAFNPQFPDVRNARESCELHGIRQPVVSQIQSLQRIKLLHAS
jgi:hypothetical protein